MWPESCWARSYCADVLNSVQWLDCVCFKAWMNHEPSIAERMLVLLLTVQLDSVQPSKVDDMHCIWNNFWQIPFHPWAGSKIWTRRQPLLKIWRHLWKSAYYLPSRKDNVLIELCSKNLVGKSKHSNSTWTGQSWITAVSLQFKRVQEQHEVKLVWQD